MGVVVAVSLGLAVSAAGSDAQSVPLTPSAPLKFLGSGADSALLQASEKSLLGRLNAVTPAAGRQSSSGSSSASGKLPVPGSLPGTWTTVPRSAIAGPRLLDAAREAGIGLLAVAVAELPAADPWFEPAGLSALAADVPSARQVAQGYAQMASLRWRDRYQWRLMASVALEGQGLYCRTPIRSLADLKARRVRAEGAWLGRLLEQLAATPVTMAVRDVRAALASKSLDCAIGGTMSGNLLGWHEVSTSLYSLPLGWSLTQYVFAEPAWNALDPSLRGQLQSEFRQFESRAWEGAAVLTREGFNCNAGIEPCGQGKRGKMNIVLASDADRALIRTLLAERVLPEWSARCGADCARAFDDSVGKAAALKPVRR